MIKLPRVRSTTVLCVRRDGKLTMAGDGQVTIGHEVLKHTARKIRRLYNDSILAGFAGSTADALSLFGRFEDKLQQYGGNLSRAAVELAKDWRTEDQNITETICSYCGVGCSLELHTQDNQIVKVTSPSDHSVTSGHLCIKGRFGWQYVHAPKFEPSKRP